MEHEKNAPVVELRDIEKSFSGVPVLKKVNFSLERGEVHALVGENGAGKSTLMNVMMGSYTPEAGTVSVDGTTMPTGYSIAAARQAGLTIIPQELALVPSLSVAENILLGQRTADSRLIRWGELRRRAQEIVDGLGFHMDVSVRTDSLPISHRQVVSIVKAVADNAKVIIMDEPTSSLSKEEVQALQTIIRGISERGTSIIYISHFLDEIFQVSDRITVLRDGGHIATVATGDITQRELISLMVGEDLLHAQESLRKRVAAGAARDQEAHTQPAPALEVKGLRRTLKEPPSSFRLYPGEVVGITGLVGAGKSELLRCIVGADRFQEGEILVDERTVRIRSPIDAYRHGISSVPEDRKLQGLCLLSSVEVNIALCSHYRKQVSRLGVLNRRKLRSDAQAYVGRLKIKVAGLGQRVHRLSGGNQQKVVISKALLTKPRILLLDEPTRGIDVGAKGNIYELIRDLRDEGMAVVFCSSDVFEIPIVSDRVLVMRDGGIVAELGAQECDVQSILNQIARGDAS